MNPPCGFLYFNPIARAAAATASNPTRGVPFGVAAPGASLFSDPYPLSASRPPIQVFLLLGRESGHSDPSGRPHLENGQCGHRLPFHHPSGKVAAPQHRLLSVFPPVHPDLVRILDGVGDQQQIAGTAPLADLELTAPVPEQGIGDEADNSCRLLRLDPDAAGLAGA